MMHPFTSRRPLLTALLLTVSMMPSIASAISGLSPGSVELQSLGPITFSTSGVLIVGDPKNATVYAIDTEDRRVEGDLNANLPKDLRASLANLLESQASQIEIGDLAVNPETGNVVLSVRSGKQIALVRLTADGKMQRIDLSKVDHAKKPLPNAPADEVTGEGRRRRNLRDQSITDLAFFDGKIIVSGLSAGSSPSSVIEFPFPFAENTLVTNVDIFHAAHGKIEDAAIQTFIPLNIDGEPSLLAGFTCTPLVNFPIKRLDGSEKVRGTTIAELGNRNRPIDMIVYEQDGKQFLLLSNSVRGVMKLSTENMGNAPGLSERVSGGGTAGQPFEKIESLADVTHMDKLDANRGIALIAKPDAEPQLKVFDLP